MQKKAKGGRKRILIAGAIIAVLALVGLAAQCTRQAEDQTEQDAIEQQAEEQQREEAVADDGLREDAQRIRDAYGEEENELIAILAKSAWAAKDGSEVRFTDRSISEVSAGAEPVERPFIVTAMQRNRYRTGDQTVDETVAALEVPEGTGLLTLTRTIAGESDSWQLKSDLLADQSGYVRAKLASGLTVTGDIDTTLAKLLGSDTTQLRSLIADYCALYYASASTATWSGQADIDYTTQTVTTDFVLDNAAATHVTMTYHTDTSSYEFA